MTRNLRTILGLLALIVALAIATVGTAQAGKTGNVRSPARASTG